MALPSNVLSSEPVIGNLLPPDNLERGLLVDYELGGVALNEASEGLDYQVWTLTYSDPDVIATPADVGDPVTLFSIAGLKEVSLAFDQNMKPFVAYVTSDDRAWYWWWDSLTSLQTHTQMEEGVISPRCTLDDKRSHEMQANDVILAYVREGNLYHRRQRDRYTIEYLLATAVEYPLDRIGMGDNLRLHFKLNTEA